MDDFGKGYGAHVVVDEMVNPAILHVGPLWRNGKHLKAKVIDKDNILRALHAEQTRSFGYLM